jgi:hypothetical protein
MARKIKSIEPEPIARNAARAQKQGIASVVYAAHA